MTHQSKPTSGMSSRVAKGGGAAPPFVIIVILAIWWPTSESFVSVACGYSCDDHGSCLMY